MSRFFYTYFNSTGRRYLLWALVLASLIRANAQAPCTNFAILQQSTGHEVSISTMQGLGTPLQWTDQSLLVDDDFLSGAKIQAAPNAIISKATIGVKTTNGQSYPAQTLAGILISDRVPRHDLIAGMNSPVLRTYQNGVLVEESPFPVLYFPVGQGGLFVGEPDIEGDVLYHFKTTQPFDEIRFEFTPSFEWGSSGHSVTFHAMVVSACCEADAGSLH